MSAAAKLLAQRAGVIARAGAEGELAHAALDLADHNSDLHALDRAREAGNGVDIVLRDRKLVDPALRERAKPDHAACVKLDAGRQARLQLQAGEGLGVKEDLVDRRDIRAEVDQLRRHAERIAGKYIYSFCEDKTGNKLYKQLQKNVDKARKDGADYVFIVGHLGMDGTTPQWSSESVAKNTQGVDAVIDGHSHERFTRMVKNKVGKDVLLAQTGTKLKTVGELVITPNGKLKSQLITESNDKDANIARVIAQEIKTYEPLLKQPVGEALVQLRSNDPATGERIVRNRECSLGDFVADAYRAVLDCDVVLVNGGSIRNEIKTGVISYNDLLEAFPFGNMCVVLEVNGQQILDALEMGAISYPEESGAFMQVSGLSYTIDSAVPSSIELDAKGNFVRVAGARRVSDVKIDGKPLDVKKKYTVGGTSYMLKSGGDGMTMFKGAHLVQDEMMSDADTIMEYLQNHLNGKVGEQYANPYGDGRIVIK